MAWAAIKGYVAKKNVTGNINNVMKLVEEKVNAMGEHEWTALCDKVIRIEEEYKKSDVVIDDLTDQFIIHVSENESEEEDGDSEISEESDEESSSDEEPSTSREDVFVEGVAPL